MKETEIINKAKEGYNKEFNELADNLAFLNQLKEVNQSKKKSFFLLWLSKPVPAYSLALASLLFMLLFYTVKPKPTELVVYKNPETLIQYDTIMVRDTIRIEKEIKSVKYKPEKKLANRVPKQTEKRTSTPIQTIVNNSEFYFDASQVSEQQNLAGSSSANSELAQFLGVRI